MCSWLGGAVHFSVLMRKTIELTWWSGVVVRHAILCSSGVIYWRRNFRLRRSCEGRGNQGIPSDFAAALASHTIRFCFRGLCVGYWHVSPGNIGGAEAAIELETPLRLSSKAVHDVSLQDYSPYVCSTILVIRLIRLHVGHWRFSSFV